jgi:hypothetical protein
VTRPYHLFATKPAVLKGLGLAVKLPALVSLYEKAQKAAERLPTPHDWVPLVTQAKALRALGAEAAQAVDQTLVRERCFGILDGLLADGGFSFDAHLTTRGLAIYSPLTGTDPNLWAFAHRHRTEAALLQDHDAFPMLPLDGWSFFGAWATGDPAGFFAVNNRITSSEHFVGCPNLEDAALPVYGHAVERLFQALLWLEDHQPGTNVVQDKGPGWNLRTEAALQTALLAGWPTGILAQRWASMARQAGGTKPISPKSPQAWGQALLSAHGQMALAAQVSALTDNERWTAIATLWRAHGWEKRQLGKLHRAIHHQPTLQRLFQPDARNPRGPRTPKGTT